MLDSFATPEEVSTYSQGLIASDDPRTAAALDAGSAAIRRYCGWHIWPVLDNVEITLDGPGGRSFELPTMFLDHVTSITEDGVLLDPTFWKASALGSVWRLDSFLWTRNYGGLDVVFTHGYPDVPDIQQLLLTMVVRALISPSGAIRESAGGETVIWGTMSPGVAAGLPLLDHEKVHLGDYVIETI